MHKQLAAPHSERAFTLVHPCSADPPRENFLAWRNYYGFSGGVCLYQVFLYGRSFAPLRSIRRHDAVYKGKRAFRRFFVLTGGSREA